jgi:hypothetical protein
MFLMDLPQTLGISKYTLGVNGDYLAFVKCGRTHYLQMQVGVFLGGSTFMNLVPVYLN